MHIMGKEKRRAGQDLVRVRFWERESEIVGTDILT